MAKISKVAFLITAYKDVEQLNVFVGQILRCKDAVIYIHIDSKANFDNSEVISDMRVKVIDVRVSVEWGDLSQAVSIFALFKEAILDADIEYVSLHSEADLAVRPIEEFVELLRLNKASGFMDANRLPAEGWGHGGGLEKIGLKYPKIFRRKVSKNHPIRYLRSAYQIAYDKGIIRGTKLPEHIVFYGGSDWFTVNRDIIERSIKYVDENPGYMELYKDSLIGNEILFATLFNIVGESKDIIMNDNLRYIDWSNDNKAESGAPKTIEMSDIKSIESSGKYFARKFSSQRDENVMKYFLKKSDNRKKSYGKK